MNVRTIGKAGGKAGGKGSAKSGGRRRPGAFLAGLAPAAALLAASPAAADERLVTRAYDESAVVRIEGKLGVQAAVSFGEGEQIENVAVGDAEKWQITPNKRANLLFVKPLAATARTNMTVVTDRHTYFFDLVASPGAEPIYMLRFTYGDEAPAGSGRAPGGAQLASLTEAERAALDGDPVTSPADPALLNFSWRRKGSEDLLPVRVYDDGRATYLLWGERQDVPAILIENEEGEEGPVNFAVRGNTVVIDGVPGKILLRAGKARASLENLREDAAVTARARSPRAAPAPAPAPAPASRPEPAPEPAPAAADFAGIPATSPAAAPSRAPRSAAPSAPAASPDPASSGPSPAAGASAEASAFDAAFAAGAARPAGTGGAVVPSDPALLNFAWRRRGDAGLLPARAYDDGRAAYLLWGEKQNVPAILVRGKNGKEAPADFAVRGNTVVIEPVPERIVLRAGKERARLDNLREPLSPAQVAAAREAAPAGAVADPALLNFAWDQGGAATLLPARVYDDGRATYLLWGERQDIPAILVADAAGRERPVDFAVRGNTIVIDAVPRRIVLRAGAARAALDNLRGALPLAATGPNRSRGN